MDSITYACNRTHSIWAWSLVVIVFICPLPTTATTPEPQHHTITLHIKDAPIRSVLHLIAEESGLNLVVSDQVEGHISLRLNAVPWPSALELILQSQGLAVRDLGEVLWIAPQTDIAQIEQAREDARLALEDRIEMVTEHIPLSHADASGLARLLSGSVPAASTESSPQNRHQGFLSTRGQLSFDQRTNALILIDTPARTAEIKRLVNARPCGLEPNTRTRL